MDVLSVIVPLRATANLGVFIPNLALLPYCICDSLIIETVLSPQGEA